MTPITITAPMLEWLPSPDDMPDSFFTGSMLNEGIANEPLETSVPARPARG